jgi:hypothetical protein
MMNEPPAPETDAQQLARLIEERRAQALVVYEQQQKLALNRRKIAELRRKLPIEETAYAPVKTNPHWRRNQPEEAQQPAKTVTWVEWNGRKRPRFYELLDELRDLHDKKAHDYAPGEDRFKNFRGCESLGIPAYEGAIVRMLDKVSRITNLVERGKKGDAPAVVDESLIDTFRDLACYALICIELYEDHCARSA